MISLARMFVSDVYMDNAGCDIYDIDEILSGCSPSDLLLKFYYGGANPRHDVFYFDGYANISSYETWSDWFDDMVDECVFKELLINNGHIAGEDIEAVYYDDSTFAYESAVDNFFNFLEDNIKPKMYPIFEDSGNIIDAELKTRGTVEM